MKVLIYFFALTFSLLSCSEKSSRENIGSDITLNGTSKILLDTVPSKEREFETIDTSLSANVPEIRSLPFGPRLKRGEDLFTASSDFYEKIIGNNLYNQPVYTPTYRLPPVRKVHYVPVFSNYDDDSICHNYGIPIDSVLLVNKYKCRLPNIYQWEVYYMANATEGGKDFTPAFQRYCGEHICNHPDGYYGLLIFYDKSNQTAQILTIYSSAYVDALNVRTFYIDKNYFIFVGRQMFTDGDQGSTSVSDGPLYRINITPLGSFEVRKLQE